MNEARHRLTQGVQQLDIVLSDTQIDALLAFNALIEKWNKAYNLTAVRDPLESVALHLLDSLSVLPHIPDGRIADIGTGAGLPGIPLAIVRPDVQFVLVDANAKKTRFVQQAVLELKLPNVQVVHGRVEEIADQPPFDAVICRAFASLADIVQWSAHLLAEHGVLLAMKSQTAQVELQQVDWQYQLIELSVPGVDAERCLIRLTREAHG
jgi:16S rRNA (guanine527-N7)-methyltransferase